MAPLAFECLSQFSQGEGERRRPEEDTEGTKPVALMAASVMLGEFDLGDGDLVEDEERVVDEETRTEDPQAPVRSGKFTENFPSIVN